MTPTGRTRVGRSYFLPAAPEKGRLMTPLPNSLSISLWVVGCCWAVAAIAYVTDSETGLAVPLAIIGALTGLAEWLVRRQRH
jgi:hypothetical protein